MAIFDGMKQFLKVSVHRLDDAKELMEQPTHASTQSNADTRHLRGAMYLAGYAVECLVKAYLIDLNGCQTLTQAQVKINSQRLAQGKESIEKIASSAAGHDIDYLIRLTDLGELPGYDPQLWGRVSQWKSTWRYESATVQRDKAQRFLNDVASVTDWLKPRVIG